MQPEVDMYMAIAHDRGRLPDEHSLEGAPFEDDLGDDNIPVVALVDAAFTDALALPVDLESVGSQCQVAEFGMGQVVPDQLGLQGNMNALVQDDLGRIEPNDRLIPSCLVRRVHVLDPDTNPAEVRDILSRAWSNSDSLR